jgi:hypothetical protein
MKVVASMFSMYSEKKEKKISHSHRMYSYTRSTLLLSPSSPLALSLLRTNLFTHARAPAATPALQLQTSTSTMTSAVDTFPYEILSTISTPASTATRSTDDVITYAFPARRQRGALNLVPQDSLGKLPLVFSTNNQTASSSILRTQPPDM